jgi:DNA-binding NarL/FixJ family response regulator
VRVVIADDSVLFREGLARVLEDAGFQVVGRAADGEELIELIEAERPDVAIADVRMPPTHTDEGLQAALAIRRNHPETGVLVLSQYLETKHAVDLVGEAGTGYLLKDRVADLDALADAVRRVGSGGSAVDPAVVAQLVGRRRAVDPLERLSPREREVLALMAEGRSNGGLAERLGVTERAVQKHITSIFRKLELEESDDDHRRVLAVLAFLRA